ncbi:IS1 family transposase [Aeromonas media]|nr:IS1 family transposase [Aeromonas media]
MASITVCYPRCNSYHVYRHGKTPTGHVRYRCPACPHVFQLTYPHEARKPGRPEREMSTGARSQLSLGVM